MMFLILGTLLIGTASAATATIVQYQSNPSVRSLYGADVNTYWPILDNPSECNERQDILLNIAPLGCEPVVVRSDILAEQNVPVFCQIHGLNINPLLDIKGLRNIRFTGQYPPEVAGVGFHPAQAALKSRETLLGDPLASNLGYAVVVLKQNADEESLPEFVDVNLSAQINYVAGNAFGIGKYDFKLKRQNDEEWELDKEKQSFWNGRYSIRLTDVESERAAISIYQGDFRESTISVNKGESELVYVSGSYCQNGLRVYYDGSEADEKKVKIEISDETGSDVQWLTEGSRFLNDKCSVRDIEVDENGRTGIVELSCGSQTITLQSRARDNSTNVLIDQSLGDYEEEFQEAIASYELVADDYPAERKSPEEGAEIYGETALKQAIALVQDERIRAKKPETEARLLNKFVELYPDSKDIARYQSELRRLYSVDSSLAGDVILLDNRYRTIRALDFEAGPEISAGASFNIAGEGEGEKFSLDLDKERTKTSFKNEEIKSINLRKVISEREVEVSINCRSKDDSRSQTKNVILTEDFEQEVCNGVNLMVEEVKSFEPVAVIRIVPETKNTQTETTLHLRIGIEKRAIKLSPEKTTEKIENLNKSIEKWNSISDSLGNVVKGMKAACLATSAALITKNFLGGLDGTATARRDAMDGPGGWKARCQDAINSGVITRPDGSQKNVNYATLTECFNAERSLIESEVEARTNALKSTEEILGSAGDEVGTGDSDVVVYDEDYNEALISEMKEKYGAEKVNSYLQGENAQNYVSQNDLRELAYNLELEKNSGADVSLELDRVRDRIEVNKEFYDDRLASENANGLMKYGVTAPTRDYGVAKAGKFLEYSSGNLDGIKVTGGNLQEGQKAVYVGGVTVTRDGKVVSETPGSFLVVGEVVKGEMRNPSAVYRYEEVGKPVSEVKLTEVEGYEDRQGAEQFLKDNRLGWFREEAGSFSNQIAPADRVVRYFGTGPDKGMAAVAPFDVDNGWYARVVSLGTEIPAYDSSGAANSWQICNVGTDGRVDTGDECQIIFSQTAANIPVLGLGESQSQKLVERSRIALREANSQRGNKLVNIFGEVYDQSTTYSHYDSPQCQDFMSVSDCQILFNVCDPVICPASRCDLGGEWPVADVVQTGIVGSALLCLPNIREGVVIPVCLTGIKSGIDGYVSILESHQQCLIESLETGNQIGICDQISSVYMCDFFWRQITPVAKEVLPRLVSGSYNGFGRGVRGGGEYSSVQAAFDNTDESIDYFTQTYAVNSFEAFQARSLEEAGTEFCRAFVAVSVPTDFETLVAPDSPPQFHAWFSSTTFTDVTVPATSQYKVFYHIFAGENQGVAFSVYLKDPPQEEFYSVPSRIQVDSGFIGRGEFKTESMDFTAPEGYQQLCVMINGKEECGFKQVTSSFALDYLRDKAVEGSLSEQNVRTAEECISGSTNPAALLNPNIQAGAEEALNPAIYNRGIVRICATSNPGAGTEAFRFVDVGYCGDQQTRCWLDKNSVDNAITTNNLAVKNATLSELEERQQDYLIERGEIYGKDESISKIEEFEKQKDDLKKNYDKTRAERLVQDIENNFLGFFLNYQKANVRLIEAMVKGIIIDEELPAAEKITPPKTSSELVEDENQDVVEEDINDSVVDQEPIFYFRLEEHPSLSGRQVYVVYRNNEATDFYMVNLEGTNENLVFVGENGERKGPVARTDRVSTALVIKKLNFFDSISDKNREILDELEGKKVDLAPIDEGTTDAIPIYR